MTREVYSDSEFIQFSRKHVFVRVFADTNAEGMRLLRRFRIEATPTLVVLDSAGKEIDRIVGGLEAQELIDVLEEIMQSSKSQRYHL